MQGVERCISKIQGLAVEKLKENLNKGGIITEGADATSSEIVLNSAELFENKPKLDQASANSKERNLANLSRSHATAMQKEMRKI